MSQDKIKEAVGKIIEGVSASPKNGQFKYQVDTKWEEDVRCSANIRNFPAMTIDEPPAFGGSDKGASPVEVVLAALGTCQEIMYSALASVMDIPLTKCSVSLQGDLDVRGLLGMGADDNVPPGFTKIYYQTTIESPATEDALRQLVAAVENQCPVLDMLVRSVEIEGHATVNGIQVAA